MLVNVEVYQKIKQEVSTGNITLVAVSKTKPAAALQELYDLGQRDFGENYVQEVAEKQAVLPADIRWHFIGHLQSNKVKYIAPFVYLIHGVDSFKLLQEINKQGQKINTIINVLLQVHIAREETKFGLDENELHAILITRAEDLIPLKYIKICGLMGMASFTKNKEVVQKEFQSLKTIFNSYAPLSYPNVSFQTLSMGMSSDYQYAIQNGSNMVRIGSLIFGSR